jgi:hypothetical protein
MSWWIVKNNPLIVLRISSINAHNELPTNVHDVIQRASVYDLMLIARACVTRITHVFNKKDDIDPSGDYSMSQKYTRGNVAILPQDSIYILSVVNQVPCSEDIDRHLPGISPSYLSYSIPHYYHIKGHLNTWKYYSITDSNRYSLPYIHP